MTINALIQISVYVVLLAALTKPLGSYMTRVFSGERTLLDPLLRPVERRIYQVAGVNPAQEMRWTAYALAMLAFNLVGLILLFAILRLQGSLPLNPAAHPGVAPDLAFNTAVSFVTNTNWQAYAGEQSMSHLTQMLGLTVQNFVSAAVGIGVALALIRGFSRRSAQAIGNFWVDIVRATLWVLLPLSIVLALVFVSQGVIQNLDGPHQIAGLTGDIQTIAQGPVASQEAIKLLGTNGGGFFNANSSHPFENPTPITNLLQMLAILAIPAGLTYTFGRMVGDTRQGWTIFGVMMVLLIAGAILTTGFESRSNDLYPESVSQAISDRSPGGNMEGKEERFGIASSTLYAVITTAASCGAVNAMHDSFTGLGGLVPLNNMALGEVIFGGVGAGMYGVLLFAVLVVFIAGLMVGRTPEYLGKKIGPREMKFVMVATLALPFLILTITALSSVTASGLAGPLNAGPQGFSEMLYAATSGVANNGSAFAGLSANTPWYNIALGIAMLGGRFLIILPVLALAGAMVAKTRTAANIGTFSTTGPLFGVLLIGVILIIAALNYFPAYALGPVVEDLFMSAGKAAS